MKKIYILLGTFLFSCVSKNVDNETIKITDSLLLHTDTLVKLNDSTHNYRILETIETINFKHNSSTINPKELKRLKKLADICSSDSLLFLKVFGFTDTIGTENKNEKLSEKRAMAVYNYLDPNAKLDKKTLYVDWLGESNEIYDLHFPKAHSMQNSVDIWIMTRKEN